MNLGGFRAHLRVSRPRLVSTRGIGVCYASDVTWLIADTGVAYDLADGAITAMRCYGLGAREV